jgi:ELWxxDGT repeat protein
MFKLSRRSTMLVRLRPGLFSLALLAALPLAAAEPYLVKDINPVAENPHGDPRRFVSLDNGIALFQANAGYFDPELWRSDGSVAGTYQLTETCDTITCTTPFLEVAHAGDRFFYLAATAPDNRLQELWVTSGSPADTFRLASPLRIDQYAARLWVKSRGLFFFVADDGKHGAELWRSDGTPAGTYMLADLTPGAFGTPLYSLVEFRGRVYFYGQDSRGPALWMSDGTPAGTQLVKDLDPRSRTSGGPGYIGVLGSHMLFFGGPKADLWRSDGTAKGTVRIATIFKESLGSFIWEGVVRAGRYYFTTETLKDGEELWVSDGTAAGTRKLTNFARPKVFYYWDEVNFRDPLYLPDAATASRMVFALDDGEHGIEPWVTDGTPQGTRLLRDLCPGSCSSDAWGFHLLGSRLIFTAGTPTQGYEPWSTDGTPAGTRLLRDACAGSCSSLPFGLRELGNGRIFGAADANQNYQLWKTNGTLRGTTRITSFQPESAFLYRMGSPVRGAVLFAARTPREGGELWRTDGTAAGTYLLRDLWDHDLGGSRPHSFQAIGNRLFFVAKDGVHQETLWVSDGTEAGTSRVRAFDPDEPDRTTNGWGQATAGGRYFLLRNTSGAPELWSSDGTEAGTRLVALSSLRMDAQLVSAGNRVAFRASPALEPASWQRLWTSDGTESGTRLLDLPEGPVGQLASLQGRFIFSLGRDIWISDGSRSDRLTAVPADVNPQGSLKFLGEHGGRFWYQDSDPATGYQTQVLWSTDGTAAGTRTHPDFPLGALSTSVEVLISAGSRMFLVVPFGEQKGLWVSDGTAAGTRKISSIDVPTSYGSSFTTLNGKLLFAVESEETSPYNALWMSDGTAAGTGPIRETGGDLITLAFVSLKTFGGHVYFVRDETLWRTDGTAAGTSEVGGRQPNGLTPGLNRLFFSGWDPASGTELWAVEP